MLSHAHQEKLRDNLLVKYAETQERRRRNYYEDLMGDFGIKLSEEPRLGMTIETSASGLIMFGGAYLLILNIAGFLMGKLSPETSLLVGIIALSLMVGFGVLVVLFSVETLIAKRAEKLGETSRKGPAVIDGVDVIVGDTDVLCEVKKDLHPGLGDAQYHIFVHPSFLEIPSWLRWFRLKYLEHEKMHLEGEDSHWKIYPRLYGKLFSAFFGGTSFLGFLYFGITSGMNIFGVVTAAIAILTIIYIVLRRISPRRAPPTENLIMLDSLVNAGGVAEILNRNILDRNRDAFQRALADEPERPEALLMPEASAEAIYRVFLEKVRNIDISLSALLHHPDQRTIEGVKRTIEAAMERMPESAREGMYLKIDKAKELLKIHPPTQIMSDLGYASVHELLEKEDIFTVFSIARYCESEQWLDEFIDLYRQLTPDDFERRTVEICIIDPDRFPSAVPHLLDKLSISNDKVVGTIFGMPIPAGRQSYDIMTLRNFTRALHYLYEIDMYSRFTQSTVSMPDTFGERFSTAIRGYHSTDEGYLSPHIVSENLAWEKTVETLASMSAEIPELSGWNTKLEVCGYRFDESGNRVLVTLNLVDLITTLSRRQELPGSTLHVKRANWNKVLTGFLGSMELLEEITLRNLDRSKFEASQLRAFILAHGPHAPPQKEQRQGMKDIFFFAAALSAIGALAFIQFGLISAIAVVGILLIFKKLNIIPVGLVAQAPDGKGEVRTFATLEEFYAALRQYYQSEEAKGYNPENLETIGRGDGYAEVHKEFSRIEEVGKVIDRVAKETLSRTPRGKKPRALDVCAGGGLCALQLGRNFAKRKGGVIAIDYSPALLDRLRDGAAELGLDNIHEIYGDVRHLEAELGEYANGGFDIITIGYSAHLFKGRDFDRLLGAMRRLLKPGGTLVVAYRTVDMERDVGDPIIEMPGFEIVESVPLGTSYGTKETGGTQEAYSEDYALILRKPLETEAMPASPAEEEAAKLTVSPSTISGWVKGYEAGGRKREEALKNISRNFRRHGDTPDKVVNTIIHMLGLLRDDLAMRWFGVSLLQAGVNRSIINQAIFEFRAKTEAKHKTLAPEDPDTSEERSRLEAILYNVRLLLPAIEAKNPNDYFVVESEGQTVMLPDKDGPYTYVGIRVGLLRMAMSEGEGIYGVDVENLAVSDGALMSVSTTESFPAATTPAEHGHIGRESDKSLLEVLEEDRFEKLTKEDDPYLSREEQSKPDKFNPIILEFKREPLFSQFGVRYESGHTYFEAELTFSEKKGKRRARESGFRGPDLNLLSLRCKAYLIRRFNLSPDGTWYSWMDKEWDKAYKAVMKAKAKPEKKPPMGGMVAPDTLEGWVREFEANPEDKSSLNALILNIKADVPNMRAKTIASILRMFEDTDRRSKFIEELHIDAAIENNVLHQALLDFGSNLIVVGIPLTEDIEAQREGIKEEILEAARGIPEKVEVVFVEAKDDKHNLENMRKEQEMLGARTLIPISVSTTAEDLRMCVTQGLLTKIARELFELANPYEAREGELRELRAISGELRDWNQLTIEDQESRLAKIRERLKQAAVFVPIYSEQLSLLSIYNMRVDSIVEAHAVSRPLEERPQAYLEKNLDESITAIRVRSTGEAKLQAKTHLQRTMGTPSPLKLQIRLALSNRELRKLSGKSLEDMSGEERRALELKLLEEMEIDTHKVDLVLVPETESIRAIAESLEESGHFKHAIVIVDYMDKKRNENDVPKDVRFMEYDGVATPDLYDVTIGLHACAIGDPDIQVPGGAKYDEERGWYLYIPRIEAIEIDRITQEIERYNEVLIRA